MDLSVDQAAQLLHVRTSTVRSRLRSGELRAAPGAGPVRVRLEPSDYIRSEDAAAILGVSPTTVRAAIDRGRLAGRRSRRGRWLVRLESVLDDPRADETARRLAGGDPVAEEPPAPATPRAAARHDLFVRLDPEEQELLELAAARHGSKRAAVAAGLRVLVEQEAVPGEVAELRVERDVLREQLDVRDRDRRELVAIVRRQAVDELYCPTCERMVPLHEWGYERVDEGAIEVYHARHGHQQKTRLKAGSVMGRRSPLAAEDQTEGGK